MACAVVVEPLIDRQLTPVMRAEGVLRLILNVSLYVGMSVLEDGKYVRVTVFEDGEKRFITFRVSLGIPCPVARPDARSRLVT
jgi:hypothetical protein